MLWGLSYFFWRRLQTDAGERLTAQRAPLYEGDEMNPSEHIDKEIARHSDWRGQTMGEVRRIIHETVPGVTEEWKWMGTPTWSHNGILCICNAFKDMVKVTFINCERERFEEASACRRGVQCCQGKEQGEAKTRGARAKRP